MRDKLIRKVTIWMSCAVVIGSLGYSTLVLSAKPAYADTVCEPEDCTYLTQTVAPSICSTHRGVQVVLCPFSQTSPDAWQIRCNDTYVLNGNCSGF
jgi:hypothetical protein